MKRLLLLSVMALGCAHVPHVEYTLTDSRSAAASVRSELADVAAGAVNGVTPSKASYGAVNVTTGAAVQIFTTGAGGTALVGRNTFNVQNKGPNSIYCGWDNSVTTSTGTEVTSGTSVSIDITWYGATSDGIWWCRAATADQVSPANTRWLQVR